MENKKLKFNDDQKAVVDREIRQAYNALATLLDWVKTDSLREEMKETLPKLVDNYMNTVKETIGFTGEESEREKEMTESIGKHYQKQINDLQQALDKQGTISSLSANVELAFKKIDKWWDIEGFNFIRERQITAGGSISLELGFMLDSFTSNYSKTPVSDKEELRTKVQYLMDKGFRFTPKKRGFGMDLIDNDSNRELLHKLVRDSFPSSKILSFKNHLRRTNNEKEDCFVIRGVEIIISDLSDVDRLEIVEKYFLFEDDE